MNVVANLIAAAIIYLLGVAVGLLPHSGPAIAAAVAFLAIAALVVSLGGAVVFARNAWKKPAEKERHANTSLMLASCGSLALGTFLAMAPLSGTKPGHPLAWIFYGPGLLMVALGLHGIYEAVRLRRREGQG
ncbi:hypothetical protein [Actinoplanes sp. NPDC049316]|uniref:hypothetical protein n=1 Tax=Actinoplanes sp. NPDC049316 TaxID=3154727 RepID=UPI003415CD3B